MDDYPNPEEEFEAMYADEFELLREQEDEDTESLSSKSRKSLKFPEKKKSPVKVLQSISVNQNTEDDFNSSFNGDFTPISQQNQEEGSELSLAEVDKFIQENSQAEKRTYSSLFGDIDDIEDDIDEAMKLPKPKKLKLHKNVNHDEEFALIEHIVEMRKLAKEKNYLGANFGKSYVKSSAQRLRDNLSYTVPKYSYVSLKRCDGVEVYVRCHSEQFEKEERQRITHDLSFSGLLGGKFKDIWKEAKELMEREEEFETNDLSQTFSQHSENNTLLWVDVYKPRKYIELLSDEGTNRTLLRWLKLWDKVVFNRRVKVREAQTQQQQQFNQRFELNTELDEHNRPHFKVALLCGPPGLGKTTLAHMVARHAGYKVIEVNASDDRNIDSFKNALDNATQMTSVLDREKRPNCLVFDEIDGAPTASIDFLIKYVTGNHSVKAKKGKKGKSTILKRPIICICNDVYVPALRALRQISFVVHFPATSTQRLAGRLNEICTKEGIQAHNAALVALGEKSNNDIRSCLSVLHFFKTQNKPVTLSEVTKVSIGQKDVQKGLFSVWQDIFQIERPKTKGAVVSMSTRWNKVQSMVASFGDYTRLAQGVFENFPLVHVKDSTMAGTCEALEWFSFSDLVNAQINALQNYSLGGYLQYGFIVWHYVFGSLHRCKLSYPSVAAEVRLKTQKNSGLIDEVMKGMRPSVRAYTNRSAINMDTLPMLSEIITPPLRPVSIQFYTNQEKEEMTRIVSVMIDYNLNYVQERNQEGSYIFAIDPNIDTVVRFSKSFNQKRNLSYSNKQMIAREIEMEKMRRVEVSKTANKPVVKVPQPPAAAEKKELPNHLQRLKPKALNTSKKSPKGPKNFFVITTNSHTSSQETDIVHSSISGDIWYQFKEGHTNAVKKTVKISTLL